MPSNLAVPPPLVPVTLEGGSTSSSAPRRKIFTAADLEPWFASRAYADFEGYTLELCHAVQGRAIDEECFESDFTRRTVAFLEEAAEWIDEVPLQTTPQRFGNKAFRDWLEKVKERNDSFQNSLLPDPPSFASILPELSFNFLTSFGSGPRLDYGTGHELSFLLWLLSLRLVGILSPRDNQAVVLRVFAAYLDLVRKLQKVFKLEPAGSKGVWGLDDHQHLSYLFGASQLIDHPTLRPAHILQPRILAPFASSYLLPSSILHIHALKSGPFSEHSPLLHQIASTVPNWTKVQSGLWKMYREEVLAKVPVVQHLRFGNLIRWTTRDVGEELPSTGDGREDQGDDDAERDTTSLDGVDQGGFVKAPWLQAPVTGLASSSSNAPVLSAAAARRTPYSVSSAGSTSRPTSFAPPTLFPTRQPARTIDRTVPLASQRTLAEEGGAAALSSPFGVLASATRAPRTTEVDDVRRPVDTSVTEPATKAPWAR
ncbi:hypothetical protein JCM11491_006646 [Sporobolomyces phaffii]